MQWKGPFPVIKRHDNGVDYLVRVKNKIRLYHINMLKKYVRRDGGDKNKDKGKDKVCQMCIVDDSKVAEDTCDITVLDKSESKFNINNHLDCEEKSQLDELLNKYSDVFSDEPGITNAIIHDIILTTDIPVHRKPYPVPHHLLKEFDNEVDLMLKLGVIEPFDSPYCSPVVLVKKADNTWRFCVDFRALNDVFSIWSRCLLSMERWGTLSAIAYSRRSIYAKVTGRYRCPTVRKFTLLLPLTED